MNKAIKIFKHLFIPHIHNDYKPHFFREASIASILVVVIILLSVSVGSKLYIKNTNMTSAVLPAVLVDLANKDRALNGEPALTRNEILDEAARLKATDMATYSYFAHTSPTGATPWVWFNKAGYSFVYAGENLAIDFTESADVENAWLKSPKHRENIMSSNFTEIGIATAEGTYNGTPTTYVVQMFGKPTFTQPVKVAVAPTPKPTIIPKPKIAKIEVSTPQLAIAPIVKGASTTTVNNNLKTISETKDFIAVKNTVATEVTNPIIPPAKEVTVPKYSTWKDRFIFSLPNYADHLYKILSIIIILALIAMMAIEVRRQHAKNIAYGALILVIIVCFIFINQSMFVTSLIS